MTSWRETIEGREGENKQRRNKGSIFLGGREADFGRRRIDYGNRGFPPRGFRREKYANTNEIGGV